MPAIVWDASLEIGIKMLDEQHKELFRRANALFQCLAGTPDKTKIKEMMQFLIKYVEEHFEAEQKAMKTYNYPKRMAHAFEHDYLKKSVHSLMADYINCGDILIPAELGNLVSTWMLDHIKKSDVEFVRFVKEKAKSFAGPLL
jgi:hemerythrin